MPISDTNGAVDVSTRRPASQRRGLRRDGAASRATRPSQERPHQSTRERDNASCDAPLKLPIAKHPPYQSHLEKKSATRPWFQHTGCTVA